ARFVSVRPRDRILELGAGCGVISLAIAALHQPHEIVAIDIQPELVAMIRHSAELNGIDSIRAVEADLRALEDSRVPRESFEVVIANPPYRASNAGRSSPNAARHLARSEASATLEDFVAASSRCARRRGRVAFVFTADRSAELITMLRAHCLEPKRIRFVHPYVNAPATMVLIEARKNGGIELAIEPPLIVFDAPHAYSREARELLGEVASHSTTK
ncbi:MAG TPA: methyltransferase, partial [Candidatus Binataceae bacterium]|nr:methyltransferase [Candidatus Binataceae bacterium]